MIQEQDKVAIVELRVIQNQVGKFNLADMSEETLSFSMGLYSEGKIVEVDGVKAIIRFSGDADERDEFREPFENLDYVFRKCYEDSGKWVSSTNYSAQCHLFAKLYSENYEAIDDALVEKHKVSIKKKIAELEKELSYSTIVPDITETANDCIEKEISKYKKWIDMNNKEIEQLKEGSPKLADLKKKNEGHQSKIDLLESKKITTNGNV